MKNGTRSANAASVIVASLIFSVSSSADDTLFRNWPMTETNITLALEEGRKQRREGCELVLGRSRPRSQSATQLALLGPPLKAFGLSVSTSFSLICQQSAQYAARGMGMTRDDVTEEMLRPVLTVVARPDQAGDEFFSVKGVKHVVIASTGKKNPKILQPLEVDQRVDSYLFTFDTIKIPYVLGYFDLEEVIAVSKLDKKREFFIIRVAPNGSEIDKKIKIKTKHFKHLR